MHSKLKRKWGQCFNICSFSQNTYLTICKAALKKQTKQTTDLLDPELYRSDVQLGKRTFNTRTKLCRIASAWIFHHINQKNTKLKSLALKANTLDIPVIKYLLIYSSTKLHIFLYWGSVGRWKREEIWCQANVHAKLVPPFTGMWTRANNLNSLSLVISYGDYNSFATSLGCH